nr:wall-associated receptor kinase 2-like [Tanacetum cinerariifolium]
MRIFLLILYLSHLTFSAAATSNNIALPGCSTKCGNLTVAFPFGIVTDSRSCSLGPQFDVTCNTSFNPPKAFLPSDLISYSGNFDLVEVVSISDEHVRIKNTVASTCYNQTGGVIQDDVSGLVVANSCFMLSQLNNLITVGCDEFAMISEVQAITSSSFTSVGCTAICSKVEDIPVGLCSGTGCCKVNLPTNVTTYLVSLNTINGHSDIWAFDKCGYSFVGEESAFLFQGASDLQDPNFVSRTVERVPVVLDWVIGNRSCNDYKSTSDYHCQENSVCVDIKEASGGYRCSCKNGYEGNPYLSPGCHDIDECADPKTNPCDGACTNLPGSYKCLCPVGYKQDSRNTSIYYCQKNSVCLDFGGDNGGLNCSCKNGYEGNPYLSPGCHGCCLESEVPMLVYECVSNGTLFHHIHTNGGAAWLSLDRRLRIAVECAGALAYLHSAASKPIIHRDVKSANILLDENLVSKISDFGASRLIPLDQTQVSTLVQGTLGYLDPEYFHTSQLTNKSDVYSFGIVLLELLTSKKPLCMERSQLERNIATYFLNALRTNNLLNILDPRVVTEGSPEHLKAIASLVKRCLNINGCERPTMKEKSTVPAYLDQSHY